MADYSDPRAEALLRKASQSAGFNKWSGFTLVAAGNGQCELALDVRDDMTQHHGFAHGGIVGALADTACSWAAATAAGDVVTSNYSVHFLSPAAASKLRVHAQTIKAGKRQATVEARVYAVGEAGEKLVATALASIAILAERRAA